MFDTFFAAVPAIRKRVSANLCGARDRCRAVRGFAGFSVLAGAFYYACLFPAIDANPAKIRTSSLKNRWRKCYRSSQKCKNFRSP